LSDLVDLVALARAGDRQAQGDLVGRFRGMAFAYACGVVGNRADAEDVVQDAFIEAFRSLGTLRDPERFGAWVRGIVRFRALRTMRTRGRDVLLDAESLASMHAVGIEGIVEVHERIRALMTALAAMPEGDRIAATMTLLSGASQAEVAAFLGIDREAVNNRMRRIRGVLRQQGVIPMTGEAGVRDDDGKVLGVDGAAVTFAMRDREAALFDRVRIGDEASAGLIAMVSEVVSDDVFRAIVLHPEVIGGELEGRRVTRTGETATSLDRATTARFLRGLAAGDASQPIETGVLGIDLFAPVVAGGSLVIAGESGVGKVVLAEELVHRLRRRASALHVVVCVERAGEPGDGATGSSHEDGSVRVSYLLVDDASAGAIAAMIPDGVAMVALSRDLAARQIWPAIDAAASRGAVPESVLVADGRAAVREGGTQGEAVQGLVAQPFHVAEPYTKRLGITISRRTAEAKLAAALGG
jgi:RNA polymerase sigma-70 factor (ECF subfamily)